MAAPGSEGASAVAADISSAAIGLTFSNSLLVPPSLEPGSPPAPAPALLAAAEPEAGAVLELAAADPEGVAPCLPEVDAASLRVTDRHV